MSYAAKVLSALQMCDAANHGYEAEYEEHLMSGEPSPSPGA